MKKILLVCGLTLGGVVTSYQEAAAEFNFRMSGSFEMSLQSGRNGGFGRFRNRFHGPPVVYWDQSAYGYGHNQIQTPTQTDEPPQAKNDPQKTGYAPNYMTNYGNSGYYHTVGYQNYRGYTPGYYYPYMYYGGYYAAPYYWYGY